MQMTNELAQAIAQDAGNRSMRAADRKEWNQADYNAAVEMYYAVLDQEPQP